MKDNFQALAESLAKMLAPFGEVAIVDKNQQEIDIYNRLTNDLLPNAEPYQQIHLTINKNQQAKLMLIPITPTYSLRLLLKTQAFSELNSLLQQFLFTAEEQRTILPWQQTVDQLIQEYLQQNHVTLSGLSNQDKRSIIKTLHGQGFFKYQDATNYLAAKLSVSRATIYNYLNQASQLQSLQIHQVDAFTDEPFSGNPGGVVLDANNLSDTMMKKIAREMNLSETAFVLHSKKADIKLRYFTPSGAEVKFCGHSTVATLYMLAHNKILGEKLGRYELTIEAKVGIIPAAVTVKADDNITIEFRTPKITLINSKFSHQEIAEALGMPLAMINQHQPIMFEKTNQDLYLVINTLRELGKLQIDQKSAKQFAEKNNIVVFTLLCNETLAHNNHIHMRCFAPAVGIPEDPFTGSVLGGLAQYLTQNHLVDKRTHRLRIEQGHFIERPGIVELDISPSSKYNTPLVIAKARHFFSTEINL
jgi:PhzF family phenazine biosynthesis protein